MKERFIEKAFNKDTMVLIEWAGKELEKYAKEGYSASLRQLYYRGVAQNLYKNCQDSYNKLGRVVSDARLAGWIDWDHIEDRGRRAINPNLWESPKDILVGAHQSFQTDLWKDQPNHVIVMVEKQAMEGVFVPVCSEYRVKFCVNKGYSSSSALYEIGKHIQTTVRTKHKNVIVIYAGDFDPSGLHMASDVHDRLQLFSQCEITTLRVALTQKQIGRYNPPPQFAKESDSRYEQFVQQHGEHCYEMDSLDPLVLAGVIKAAISAQIDQRKWTLAKLKEAEMKDHLQDVIDSFEGGHSQM